MKRRRSIGAEIVDGGVHFRVWAPSHGAVAVVIDGRDHPLDAEQDGYFSALVRGIGAGTLYKFRLDDGTYPDPASRFQPEGVHGPSQVIDPKFAWTQWPGIGRKGRVLYEMHIGTFTREGTYAAAIEHLPYLAGVGINTIELMPVNEFPGTFGWGYDGVDLWAPTRNYGTPEDLRRFVDAAHRNGVAVILDVVYNHFGPDGCYLAKFTPHYVTKKYPNEWGEAINFDGEHAHGVREFFTENAAYWIDEFRFDGLRIDATQSMFDDSEKHIVCEIGDRARAAARGRGILLIGENEPQDTAFLRKYGLDALWNDDWHHAARVAITGNTEAYFTDYRGLAREFVAMGTRGFLYQGQWYAWQKKRRGTDSADLEPERFVCSLQNHDQVANGNGLRVENRALTALLLLQPQTPMLFQGQESGAKTPFLYFADHEPALAEKVAKGRADFMAQFPSIEQKSLPRPDDRETFEKCKLDHARRDDSVVAFHRELLRLRREPHRVDGATLSDHCLVLRWTDRLLLVNLGDAMHVEPVSEPLLAGEWELLYATETLDWDGKWRIPGRCAILLRPGNL